MFKFMIVLFMAIAYAAAKPHLVASPALAYSAGYVSPYAAAYTAPVVASAAYSAPLAYASPYAAYSAYSAYTSPILLR